MSDPPEPTPLMQAPNTLFAPHIGASSKENMTRIGIMVDRIIGEWVTTKK
jgi:phosphoglycerate dehydrogenase-like enzyme